MSHTDHPGPPPPASGPLRMSTWVGFIAMSIGMFMAILDVQIVASSLPEIQAGLAIPLDRLSWVQTAYLMAEIVAIPLTGWLMRVMSIRGAFVVCIIGFTAASITCAAASGFWWLPSTLRRCLGVTIFPKIVRFCPTANRPLCVLKRTLVLEPIRDRDGKVERRRLTGASWSTPLPPPSCRGWELQRSGGPAGSSRS
jgi:MFS family permease